MALSDIRFTLAERIATAIDVPNRYAAPPRSPVRPCVIVFHEPDEYLEPGPTFDAWVGTWLVLVLAGADQPDDATDELDGYLDVLLDPEWAADEWRPIEVTGAASWTYAGGQYPGLQLTYQLPLKFTPDQE